MSALEITSFSTGLLGPIEQAINIARFIRNHLEAINQNNDNLQALIDTLRNQKNQLEQLERQLQQNQTHFAKTNHQILQSNIFQLKTEFNSVLNSLTEMHRSATTSTFLKLLKASTWAAECNTIERQLRQTSVLILQINGIIGISESIRIQKRNENQFSSSWFPEEGDLFRPRIRKIPLSHGIVLDLNSTDLFGNPSTVETRIKKQLLSPNEDGQYICSIHGPSGVGKTTILHGISNDEHIEEYFTGGIYFLSFGADATLATVGSEICEAVRDSGGHQLVKKMTCYDDVKRVIRDACEWFAQRRFLLLVDDVWNKKGLGTSIISLLSEIVIRGDKAVIVYSTRDLEVALNGISFRLEPQDVLGEESRNVLFKHANLDKNEIFNEETEKAIGEVLKRCAGLPVAHAVAGRTIRALMIRSKITVEDACVLFLSEGDSIFLKAVDGYKLDFVFRTSLRILEGLEEQNIEENVSTIIQDKKRFSYSEMHRGLSVLQKQQWVPLEMLRNLWNVEDEQSVREICQNFEAVGLGEMCIQQCEGERREGMRIHDLLHEYAQTEAKKRNEIELWHRRLLSCYAKDIKLEQSREHGCAKWWRVPERKFDYLLSNLCRHLCEEKSLLAGNEVIILVTRPQWISIQLRRNGLLQYDEDVSYAVKSIRRKRNVSQKNANDYELDRLEGPTDKAKYELRSPFDEKELALITGAARLSTFAICQNSQEVWFQIYDRLLGVAKLSRILKEYLLYIERNAPSPWLKPVKECLSSTGSHRVGMISIQRSVWCMTVLPKEKDIVCGCGNGDIIFGNVDGLSVKKTWRGHDACVSDIAISKDGKVVLTGSWDKTAKIWEVGSWRQIGETLEGHSDNVRCVAINEDRTLAITGSRDKSVLVWDLVKFKCIRKVFNQYEVNPSCLRVINNGEHEFIVCGDLEGRLRISRIGNCREMEKHEETDQEEREHHDQNRTRSICCFPFVGCMKRAKSDDSRNTHAELGHQKNKDIRVCCPKEDIDSVDIDADCPIHSIATTGDRNLIAIGCANGTVRLRSGYTPSNDEKTFYGHTDWVNHCSFSKDGRRIASGSSDCSILIRDTATGNVLCNPLRGHTGCVSGVEFLDDNNAVVSCSSDGTIRIWEIDESTLEPEPDEPLDSPTVCAVVSNDRSRFVTGHRNGEIRLWDTLSGELITDPIKVHDDVVHDVAISADDKWIVTACHDKTVGACNGNSFQQVNVLHGHSKQVRSVDVTPDSRYAVTGSKDGTIRIWDLSKCDNSHVLLQYGPGIEYVHVSRDGKRIVSVSNHELCVWDIAQQSCLNRVPSQRDWIQKRKQGRELVDGTQDENANCKKLFCEVCRRHIRFGTKAENVVLATLDSSIQAWTFSEEHKIISVVPTGRKPACLEFRL